VVAVWSSSVVVINSGGGSIIVIRGRVVAVVSVALVVV